MNKTQSINQLLAALKAKLMCGVGETQSVNRLKQIEVRAGNKEADERFKKIQEEAARQSITTRERPIPSWVVDRDNFKSKPMPSASPRPGNSVGFSIDPLLD